jgi:hypothetical protein
MVYDSDMSKPGKMQMVQFIESASEKQLQHYIIHGEVVKEKDTIVEAFFLPAVIIGAALAAGRAIYDTEFSKAAKACPEMKGAAKKECMKRFKVRGISGKISALRREMGKCNQTSRPDKCRKMFMDYIKNAEKQMRKIYSE